MSYGNMGSQPSNNLWIGNNYSTNNGGYPKNNFSNMGMQNQMNQRQMNQMQPPTSINNIFQVMGPESAQAYQIGPDSHVILMDSNRPVFYTKQSDSSGYSETHAFEFHEIPLFPESKTDQSLAQDFVTKTEFEEFKKMIEELVMKNE